MDLKDGVAIVTGSGSGIGRALALAFGAAGARVVCVARRLERIEETASLIKAAGGEALALCADVTDPGQLDAMVSRTLDAYGRIDVLFNNAGRFNVLGALWEVDPDDWWRDVEVNLRGVMLLLPGRAAPHDQPRFGHPHQHVRRKPHSRRHGVQLLQVGGAAADGAAGRGVEARGLACFGLFHGTRASCSPR